MAKYAITKDPAIVREMATKVVTEAHPGYQGGGYYVDVETWTIHYADTNRAWNPWSDGAVVVGVEECFDMENVDASPKVDWEETAGRLNSWAEIKAAYGKAEDALEDDGSLADWVDLAEVIYWAEKESEEWAAEVAEEESLAQDAAIDLVESLVLEFVEIDDEE